VIIQHQNHVKEIVLVIGLLILVWKIVQLELILQNVIRAAVVIGIMMIKHVKMNHHQMRLYHVVSIPQNSHVKEILIVIIVLVQIVPFLSVLKNV
jgi:hypothetical protein